MSIIWHMKWIHVNGTAVTNHSSDRSRAAWFVTFTPRAFALEPSIVKITQWLKVVLLTAQE
jgi:hypothetical protein